MCTCTAEMHSCDHTEHYAFGTHERHLQMPVALLEGLDHSNVVQDDKLTQVVYVTPDLCKRAFACGLRICQGGL